MASPQWTEDQKKVIEFRNRNILVSAAAGSGKTAVLVERIITMITDQENPIDIDRLLIVTFTNAAASEMKGRIGKAIEQKLGEEPDNAHLQKQMALLHSAQITTIHSFCLNVIRNYFNTIDLDPTFRIAEEAELKLLQSDVVADILEAKYEALDPDFIELVESYASGKNDAALESLILQLYHFSISYPWPLEWLEKRREVFNITTVEELEKQDFMKELKSYVRAIVKDVNQQMNEALDLCSAPGGPYMYQDLLAKEETYIDTLLSKETYVELAEAFDVIEWGRLPGKRDPNVDGVLREKAKKMRDRIKKSINDLKDAYFFQPIEEMIADIEGSKGPMNALIDLTIEFSTEYAKQKEDRGIVDFNDLEHFALNILVQEEVDQETGKAVVVPTPVAIELSEYYEELLIDEYQDSNMVQEIILNSISKEKFGKPNVFMVGDVKQSIYKFRMAKPELFLGKYKSYSTEESKYQRIDLHKNFRSRDVVLSPINYIFEQIMVEDLGSIIYDDKAALHVGASFPDEDEALSKDSELLLVGEVEGPTDEVFKEESAATQVEQEDSLEDLTVKELEAKAVAKKIKQLMDPDNGLKLITKTEGEYRPVNYSDIVILFRSMSGWSDVFIDVLLSEGIPAYAETQSGYFSTLEIRTILNLLKVIDNPRQEIPLAAVLHSPMFGFSSEQMAAVKIGQKERDLYEALLRYTTEEHRIKLGFLVEEEEYQTICSKINTFFQSLKEYRNKILYTPIYELIQWIVEDTGYYYYVKAMPAGERRTANIDMLIQRAIDFEGTSFSGLFDFIRYIEKLEKYEIDFGEASVSSEADNAVRIMSIHKSKGLEFPVVIVAGMGKNFNNQDSRSKLVLHPDLGIGPEYINNQYRVKSPTLVKKVIQRTITLENLAEELRVLYVALTRAKEKLIMVGYVKELEGQLKDWMSGERLHEHLTYQQLTGASSYLDWILPSVRYHASFAQMVKELVPIDAVEQMTVIEDPKGTTIPLKVSCMSVFDLFKQDTMEAVESMIHKEELEQWDTERIFDEALHRELEKHLSYEYPYAMDTTIRSKVTVSELKRMGQEIDNEESVPLVEEVDMEGKVLEFEPTIPLFIKEQYEQEEKPHMTAAQLGNLYHRALQYIDFESADSKGQLQEALAKMVVQGRMTAEEIGFLSSYKLLRFIQSPLGQGMKAAKNTKRLYREQPFVMGQPAKQINPIYQSEEMILVQGIIDVYWEEEDELVVLDYKTDRVDTKEELIQRYHVQLDYYKLALEQMTHKKVKEVYIYSFCLNEGILM